MPTLWNAFIPFLYFSFNETIWNNTKHTSFGVKQTPSPIFSQLNFLSHSLLSPRADLISISQFFIQIKKTLYRFWRKKIRIMFNPNAELESICRLGLKNLDMNYSYVAPGETLSFHRYNKWGSEKNRGFFRVIVNGGRKRS